MATQLKIKRRTEDTTAPSLTLGELAVNTVDNKLYVGNGSGNIIYLDSTAVVTSVNGAAGAISNVAVTTTALSQFAATTSAQLAGVINDETGTGVLVFATNPTLTTPIIGAATGTSLVLSAGITATIANFSGRVTAGGVSATESILEKVVTLTDGATVALDASLGNVFNLTTAGNRTILAPTNPTDGQKIRIKILASGANRTITLTTGAGAFVFSTYVSSLPVILSGKVLTVVADYSSLNSLWTVLAENANV